MAVVRRATLAVCETSRAVDEVARSRHLLAGHRALESTVRVAGGLPTLGGGLRGGLRGADAEITGDTFRDGVAG
jgi:hypothetical protein